MQTSPEWTSGTLNPQGWKNTSRNQQTARHCKGKGNEQQHIYNKFQPGVMENLPEEGCSNPHDPFSMEEEMEDNCGRKAYGQPFVPRNTGQGGGHNH